MSEYLRSVTRKLSLPSGGLGCGLHVLGRAEAGPVASLWSLGACGDDSQPLELVSPLSPAPDTQSRCQKSLTPWNCCAVLPQEVVGLPSLLVYGAEGVIFSATVTGLAADVPMLGPSCV